MTSTRVTPEGWLLMPQEAQNWAQLPQMSLRNAWAENRDLPRAAGNALAKTTQGVVGLSQCQGTRLARLNLWPPGPSGAALQSCCAATQGSSSLCSWCATLNLLLLNLSRFLCQHLFFYAFSEMRYDHTDFVLLRSICKPRKWKVWKNCNLFILTILIKAWRLFFSLHS